MAHESIEDGGFWLPPQFLKDDIGCEDSDSSDLCSQVESMTGSGEDWSDEEDCLAGLSSKVALSAIGDDLQKLDHHKYKGLFDSRSPKSTLRGVDDSFTPTQRLPPAAVHLLYEDGGRVAPMRMSEKVQPGEPIRMTTKSDAYFFPNQCLHQRQLQGVQRMRQQQMLFGKYGLIHRGPVGHQWAPPPQGHQKARHPSHQIGTAGTMRAALSRPPGTRPCAGTGVFLPRQLGSQPESRKKQGSAPAPPSPVLISAEVVRALNMSYGTVGSRPQQQLKYRQNGRFTPENDGLLRSLGKGFAEARPDWNNEFKLPQEWTY